MKKILGILLVLSLGTSLFAFGFSFGVKAGAPFNTIQTGSEFFPTDGYIWGGNVSAIGLFSIFGILGFQAEVGYSCRNGYEYSFEGQSFVTSFATMDIPLMIKLGLPLGFSINGGVQASFPVGKITTKGDGSKHSGSVKNAGLENVIWGWVAGLDFALPIGLKNRILIDARFAMDFDRIGSDSSPFKRRVSFTPSIGFLRKL